VVAHLAFGGVFVGCLDRLGDERVVRVDRAVEDPRQHGAGQARLQRREDRLGCDLQQPVGAALDHGRVEVPVVHELGLGVELGPVPRDRRAQPLDVAVGPSARGEACRGHFEQLARLDQLVERQVACVGQERDVGAQRLGDVVDGRQRDEAPTARPLRRADEALRGEQTERLAHGRPADTELAGQRRFGREPAPRSQPAADDQVAQLVGGLLVALAHPPERHGREVGGGLIRPRPLVLLGTHRHGAQASPNSALPATETGFVDGGSAPAK
jgi:hypothetical protein